MALVAVDMVRNEEWDGLCRKRRGKAGCRSKAVAGQNESAEYSNIYENLISPFKRTCHALKILVLRVSIGFFVNRSTPFDWIDCGSKKADTNSF